jgi:DNA-binding response OmpR family regulator
MSGELISLRLLIVSALGSGRDLLRRGATHASIPVEVVEADDAAAACALLQGEGIDLAMLDSMLPAGERAAIVKTARAMSAPPFVTLVAPPEASELSFDADGVVIMPCGLEEARRLFGRLTRVRLPTRVLVVDDSSTMRSIVRKILAASRFPFDIAEVDEGGTALQLVRKGGFDIIFLDCNMPGLDGFQTLTELKRTNSGVQVVMITSTDDVRLAQRARSDGAAFLKKPFYPADIDAVLCGYYGLRAIRTTRA